jgi:hypothetical protein
MRRPAIVAMLMLIASPAALAATAIPSSELPGRERYRFVDPPGAGLMQPTQPSPRFPGDAKPAGQGACSVHVSRTSRWKRLKRRGC